MNKTHLKTLPKYKYLFVFFFLTLISCHNDTQSIKGDVISIQFDLLNLNKLNDNMYIIIDGQKIGHSSKYNIERHKKSLPSYNNIMLIVDGKKLKEKGTVTSVADELYKLLLLKGEYIFLERKRIELQGKIILSRKDKKKIKILFPKNYPIKYKVIK
jgi:hypothetical protein